MNTKRKRFLFALFACVWLVVMACQAVTGLGRQATKDSSTATELVWPDVSLLPGAKADATVNTITSHLTEAMVPMIYYTDKGPADLVAYYTNDLMKAQGWDPQPYDVVKHFSDEGFGPATPEGTTAGGCMIDPADSTKAFCTFVKKDDSGKEIDLTIEIGPDDKSSQNKLIYVRTTSDTSP